MKIAYLVYNFKDQDGFLRTSKLSTVFLGSQVKDAIHILMEEFKENYSDFAKIEYLGTSELEEVILKVM